MMVLTTRKIARPDNMDIRRKVIRKGVDHKDILKALWVSNWPMT
jgi:hypothetical protein